VKTNNRRLAVVGGYLARRFIGIAFNLLLVSLLLFFLLRLVPGDITLTILTESSTAEQREAFREQHGLNKGPFEQYVVWLGNALTGNLDKSFRSGLNVADEFKSRFPVTMEIVILSFVFTSFIGISGGILAATKQDSGWDYGARLMAIFGVSIPSFLLLTLMLILPARWFDYAPPFGAVHFFEAPFDNLRLFVPPTLLLAIGGSATLMRLTRTAMLDVLRQDYLRTARSKGLAEKAVIFKHAIRNALPPVLTFMGLQLGTLLGGSIIVEQVMGLPGLGTWALAAIQSKDYPIVLAFSVYAAFMIMIISLAVDILYAFLDPRVRYS
jgi:peptide/nickel transport system permease protein